MSPKSVSLERIRRQIDQIDDDMHDLLMKRARLVGKIFAAKARDGGGPVMRPEREAQVLRRLLGRHKGALSPDVVGRIWRELFPAMVRLQAPLEVIVCGGINLVGNWDLARSHFGSATPTTVVKSPGQALGALARKKGQKGSVVAVVPMPGPRDDGQWWQKLATRAGTAPRIVGRLPFIPGSSGPAASAEAMVVGHLDWRPSGDDQTLIAVSVGRQTSVRQILSLMKSAGLKAKPTAKGGADLRTGRRLHLMQVSDYVGFDDDRLEDFRARAGRAVTKAIVVGGYPTCVGSN